MQVEDKAYEASEKDVEAAILTSRNYLKQFFGLTLYPGGFEMISSRSMNFLQIITYLIPLLKRNIAVCLQK